MAEESTSEGRPTKRRNVPVRLVGNKVLTPFEKQTLDIATRTYQFTKFGFWIAFGAAVFLGVQVREMANQTQILASQTESAAIDSLRDGWNARKQLAIAQQSLDTSVKAMRMDRRAWIAPKDPHCMHPVPGMAVAFQSALVNVGKTPAYVTSIRTGSKFYDGELAEVPDNPPYDGYDFKGRALIFSGQNGLLLQHSAPDYSNDVLNAIRNKITTLNFYGIVEYDDIFGTHYFTKFCYHYVVTWGPDPVEALTSCKRYNETDDIKPN